MRNEIAAKAMPDGRHLRSERSRVGIAQAMLQLIRETDSVPTTDAVADRAGVSRRSVFRHYSDVSELLTAAYELQRMEGFNRYPMRDPSGWSEDERVEYFVESASQLYEFITPVRAATNHMSHEYPSLKSLTRGDDALHSTIIGNLFSPSAAHLPAEEGKLLLAALISLSSWSHWNYLRKDQDMSFENTRAIMRLTIRAILAKVAK